MYCDSNNRNLITSENWGTGNYPDSWHKEHPIQVEQGKVIEILFTDFELEDHDTCNFDWVMIIDADGTELLGKVRIFDNFQSK